MGSKQAPFFHERIPSRDGSQSAVARVYVVRISGNTYGFATERTDGLSEAFIVFDAGTGTYRLNDASAGEIPLAYFPDSATVML